MSTFAIDITCPTCGGGVNHVNHASNGLLAITVAECSDCGRAYEVTARIRPFPKPESERRARYARTA